MLDIVVESRTNDYIAYIYGKREMWECGASAVEAIGKLIVSRFREGDEQILISFRGK